MPVQSAYAACVQDASKPLSASKATAEWCNARAAGPWMHGSRGSILTSGDDVDDDAVAFYLVFSLHVLFQVSLL